MYDELPYIRAFVRQFGRRPHRDAGQQSGKPISAQRASPSGGSGVTRRIRYRSRGAAVTGRRWHTRLSGVSVAADALDPSPRDRQTDRIIGVGPIQPRCCARVRRLTAATGTRIDGNRSVRADRAADGPWAFPHTVRTSAASDGRVPAGTSSLSVGCMTRRARVSSTNVTAAATMTTIIENAWRPFGSEIDDSSSYRRNRIFRSCCCCKPARPPSSSSGLSAFDMTAERSDSRLV